MRLKNAICEPERPAIWEVDGNKANAAKGERLVMPVRLRRGGRCRELRFAERSHDRLPRLQVGRSRRQVFTGIHDMAGDEEALPLPEA
jgi:hypothetical protein